MFLPDLGFWGCCGASISLRFSAWLRDQARVVPGQHTAAGMLWAWRNEAEQEQGRGKISAVREGEKREERREKERGEEGSKNRKEKEETFLKDRQ